MFTVKMKIHFRVLAYFCGFFFFFIVIYNKMSQALNNTVHQAVTEYSDGLVRLLKL